VTEAVQYETVQTVQSPQYSYRVLCYDTRLWWFVFCTSTATLSLQKGGGLAGAREAVGG